MSNHLPLAATIAALTLASCGPKAIMLPEDPIDRAATCGVVAAAEARTATDIREVLPFEAQSRIVHFPLLAGSAGGAFSGEAATRTSARMAELEGGITGGKWEDLIPQCRAAYLETAKAQLALPENRFEAQLGCNQLADFMVTALAEQEMDYGNELSEYRDLERRLEQPLVPGLRARAGVEPAAQKAVRNEALAAFARLGPPIAVLKLCVDRFGEKGR
ncbi:hypothetical protein [Sphingosinicella rhizophila]|uniref:Lipoprotein n=1 Tax=Sphingosinicella rhizophila TaxID=3050082 RepID=A0ABU3Q3G3_9SPHN|nr:hypothetical protein [Sphingosinicella sp. GR2756]MDT9597945.1 hypothetical protein [Sphingosinicella sp. GR2756]